jgi:transcriptional regulator with XRE-family HTH domain
MTPFGARVRQLRRERGLLLKDMAAHLGVSSAYLSALERGERGKPTWTLLQGVLQYFRIIWDEADELVRLADLSDPKVKIDASTRGPEAVLLANRLARELGALNEEDVAAMLAVLDRAAARPRPERQAPLPLAGERLPSGSDPAVESAKPTG